MYLPSRSVTVPRVEPFTTILNPGSAEPSVAEVTVPVTLTLLCSILLISAISFNTTDELLVSAIILTFTPIKKTDIKMNNKYLVDIFTEYCRFISILFDSVN